MLHTEFRTFVEQTENELYTLFQTIDRDRDGRVTMWELQEAFKKDGIVVSSSKLKQFFQDIDDNNDVGSVFLHSQSPLTWQ